MNTTGLDHIEITVSDVERTREFYEDILGFELRAFPKDYPNRLFAGTYFLTVGGVEIGFLLHPETQPNDRFDETRIGLDHLSFKAPTEEALHELAERLIEAGVETKGVEEFFPNGKKYVAFRDPDNIQLEYWLDSPASE